MLKQSLYLHKFTADIQEALIKRDLNMGIKAIREGLKIINYPGFHIYQAERQEFLAHAIAFKFIARQFDNEFIRLYSLLVGSTIKISKQSIRPDLHPLVIAVLYDFYNPRPHSMQVYAESQFAKFKSWIGRTFEKINERLNNGDYIHTLMYVQYRIEERKALITPRP